MLEILGRGVAVDTTELIWHWLKAITPPKDHETEQHHQLINIINSLGEMKIEAAQEQLRLYLFENPSCTRGRMAAAALCLHHNRLDEAVEELNSVYMRQPSNTMALYALGHCYERLGKESQAVEFYQDCLKFKDYLQPPAQRLAAIYFKNGKLEQTIDQYELLKKHYPDDMSTLVSLGYLYIAGAKYTKAIETFNTAILIHPDTFMIEDEYLEQLIRDGQLYEALTYIESLLEQWPNRPELLASQADMLIILGDTTEAISKYKQALDICPDFLEATIKLGTQYLKIDAGQLAAEQFNRAVDINDKIVDAYIGLATAQNLAGSTSDALTTLSLAAAIQPNSSLLFAQTAMLIFKAAHANTMHLYGSYKDTQLLKIIIDAHRHQISAKPRDPALYYRLGVLLMSTPYFQAATDSFRSALELNTMYARARTKLCICLFLSGRNKEALDHLIPPKHLTPNTLHLHYKISLLYCDKAKFASSLLNLHRQMLNNLIQTDTPANIYVVLENLDLVDTVSSMWQNLNDIAKNTDNINIKD